jgi:hypothetical protein
MFQPYGWTFSMANGASLTQRLSRTTRRSSASNRRNGDASQTHALGCQPYDHNEDPNAVAVAHVMEAS